MPAHMDEAPMSVPNATQAHVDREKLRGYCLSRDHPRGRHKARVFESALGLTAEDVDFLRDALLVAVQSHDAIPTLRDEFGQRYVVGFVVTATFRQADVRSTWIVRTSEDFPRFVSCFVR